MDGASMVRDLEHWRQKTDLALEPTDFSWTKWTGLHALGGPTRRIHSRRISPTPSSVTPSPRHEGRHEMGSSKNRYRGHRRS
ncbi:hypothetical protein TNCV_2518521 [Trichonephila clavipes]|nr:hypothetical protein TNCV_2518521 [Trichonephila clavipes]